MGLVLLPCIPVMYLCLMSYSIDVVKFLSFIPGRIYPQHWLVKLLVKSDTTRWRKLQVPAEPVSDNLYLYIHTEKYLLGKVGVSALKTKISQTIFNL